MLRKAEISEVPQEATFGAGYGTPRRVFRNPLSVFGKIGFLFAFFGPYRFFVTVCPFTL